MICGICKQTPVKGYRIFRCECSGAICVREMLGNEGVVLVAGGVVHKTGFVPLRNAFNRIVAETCHGIYGTGSGIVGGAVAHTQNRKAVFLGI